MRLLLTRPRDESEALAALLATRGHQCLVEPLLEVVFHSDQALELEGAQAVLLTSANGARALAARSEAHGLPAFAVGASTAEAARRAGFDAVESAGGDVNSLAALVAERLRPADGALVHVAGQTVAGDLAALLPDFEVRRVTLYEAKPAEALSETTVAALKAGELDGALLFSPRTAALLAELGRKADAAEAFGAVSAFCLSEAVADAARPLPWRRILVAERPEQAALLDMLERENPVSEPSQPAPRRGASVLAWAAGAAILAFLLGMAVWPLLGPALQPHLPESLRDPTLARLGELQARVAELERRPAPAAGPSAAEQVDPLARRLATLEREQAALAARPQPEPQPAPVDPKLLARLDQVEAGLARLDEMEATLKKGEAIEERLAELDRARESTAAAGRNSALLAALSQLREAMRAGRPYQDALKATAALARGEDGQASEGLAQLEAHAGEGLPTLTALTARFRRLSGAATHYAGLEADAGWMERAWHRLSGLVRIRRVGEARPETPAARLGRAEERLAAGDLAGAVEDVETIERRTPALDAWLADARARLQAEAALDALQARALARTDGA